jgi:hypothetical protein
MVHGIRCLVKGNVQRNVTAGKQGYRSGLLVIPNWVRSHNSPMGGIVTLVAKGSKRKKNHASQNK